MNNKKKAIKLSFEEEEDDEQELRSSKAKTKGFGGDGLRKMRQAEVKIFVAEEVKPIITSAQYDANSLQELKQKQQTFASNVLTSTEMDVEVGEEVILNGEDAEALEIQQNNPEEKLLLQHAEERKKKDRSRIFFDDIADNDRKNRSKNVDLTDLDNDWEREVMKRGGIAPSTNNMPSLDMHSKSTGRDSYSNELSDVMNLIQSTFSKLEELVRQDEREESKLKVELEICDKEIVELNKEKSKLLEEYKKEKEAKEIAKKGEEESKMIVE